MSVIPKDSLVFALPTHVNQAIIWNDSLNTFNSPNQSLAKHLPLTRFSHIKSFCHFFVLFSMLTYHIPKLIRPNPLTTQTLSLIHLNSLTTQLNSITHSITNQLTHSFVSSPKLIQPNSYADPPKLPFATLLTHLNSQTPNLTTCKANS